MVGLKRAYDFHELIAMAYTMNHFAAIEYGHIRLQFGRVYNKMLNI
jgi:hypothetical protein